MAKLEKINAFKVTKREGNGTDRPLGYYRYKFNAEQAVGNQPGVNIAPVEIYIDHDTDKIYILKLASPDGKLKD